MDTQAYRVAVLLTINDQLSKQLEKVSKDAAALDGKFGSINKNIQSITKSATAAAKALEKMNTALSGKLSAQARNASDYARSMQKAAESAASIARSSAAASSGGAAMAMVLAGSLSGSVAKRVIEGELQRAARSVSGSIGYSGGVINGEYTRIRGLLSSPSSAMLALPGVSGGGGAGFIPAGGGIVSGFPKGMPSIVTAGRRFFGGGSGGGGTMPPSGGDADFPSGSGRHKEHGMENLALAYGGFEFMKSAVETGAEYQTLLAKFSSYGMGDAAVKEADKFASATKIIGASKVDMLRYFTEAQGVFRESGEHTTEEQLKGARMAAPMLAKMHFAMTSMDPSANHMTHAKEMDMLRFTEQAGGLNSPQKFNAIMNNAYKAVQASGGNVDFSQLRQFMSRAGTSAYNLSDVALYAKLEPIIGEMKGGAAGDALMTAYNRLTGVTKLPNQIVKQLEDMGVWNKNLIVHNQNGGMKSIIGGAGAQLTDLKLLANDPVEFYERVIRPKYAAKNMTEEQIQLSNSAIFGRQGGKMFNLVEKQMHVIELTAAAFEKQMDIINGSKQTEDTYNGKKVDFEAKWKNFQLALAQDGGLLDTFTSGLSKLTEFLQTATEFSNKYPQITSAGVSLLEFLTAMSALKGGVWLLKTAFGALFSPINFLTGSKGLPLLSSGLDGLAGILGRLIPLLGLFIPTNNTPNTTQEMAERGRLEKENLKKRDPFAQYPGSWQDQYLDWQEKHPGQSLSNVKYDQNGKMYPEPRNPLQTIQVNSSIYLDGSKMGDAISRHIVKQATKAPTGVSGVDTTMNMIHAGMSSMVAR